ncbi:MAG TPA: bifunctional phosphoribosyl-AMP cyclohydrolase/phosphoribosyl-ATP diphosphatase HisIE [Kofleriaceae bacterium]|nr:bifunctional phosphoribosyl-AMP cyclohydrolase/phosphoribosyl-ATP diphosphatase HisIE [Kofleriaceae bacterium]
MSAQADASPAVRWDERGLAPAVVCHAETGAVLMLAWMNAEALAATRATGEVHFYSRSRQALWRKGESSGNTLALRELRLDCDGDALLVIALPAGPTCHTGAPSCFFRRAGDNAAEEWIEDAGPGGAPAAVVDRLYAVLASRRGTPPAQSYTASLLAGGPAAINAKIGEEAAELCAELADGAAGPQRIAEEAADVIYHVLVGLLGRDVAPGAVWRELEKRFGRGGHAEKASRR